MIEVLQEQRDPLRREDIVKLTALEPLAVQKAGVAHPQGFNVVGKYVVPIKSDEDQTLH
jgi:hypothetical protein